MDQKMRRFHPPAFKAKVVLDALKGTKNLGRTFITVWDTCNGDFEMERASRENFGRGGFQIKDNKKKKTNTNWYKI